MTARACVLDVGHGNAGLVFSDDRAFVVDAAPGDTLLRTLAAKNIDRVDAMLLSHSDNDHVGGAAAILSAKDVDVGAVYVNPDPTKRVTSRQRRLFVASLEDAQSSGRTNVVTQINTALGTALSDGALEVEVVAPTLTLALAGVGSVTASGETVTSNALSAVVRAASVGTKVLFAGDIDGVGLRAALTAGVDLRASVLVFPHHGGRSGGSPAEFASQLVSAVEPEVVIFSFARRRYANPLPEVIDAVRNAKPGVRILCTQLSRHCAPDPPPPDGAHHADLPRAGETHGPSCAGSVEIDLAGTLVEPSGSGHMAYIQAHAPSALCLRSLAVGISLPMAGALP